jgi:hypothetical protein
VQSQSEERAGIYRQFGAGTAFTRFQPPYRLNVEVGRPGALEI